MKATSQTMMNGKESRGKHLSLTVPQTKLFSGIH
jgi:hypothetical protein